MSKRKIFDDMNSTLIMEQILSWDRQNVDSNLSLFSVYRSLFLNNSFVKKTEENFALRKDVQEEDIQDDIITLSIVNTIKTMYMISANLLIGLSHKFSV